MLFPRTKSVLFIGICLGKSLKIPEGLAGRAAHQSVISGAAREMGTVKIGIFSAGWAKAFEILLQVHPGAEGRSGFMDALCPGALGAIKLNSDLSLSCFSPILLP